MSGASHEMDSVAINTDEDLEDRETSAEENVPEVDASSQASESEPEYTPPIQVARRFQVILTGA